MDKSSESELDNLLKTCDTEPIRIPGAIQPHGVLMALRSPDFTIAQVSRNVESMLGVSPETLLGERLFTHFRSAFVEKAEQDLSAPHLREVNPIRVNFGLKSTQAFNGIAHRHQGILILELERARLRDYDPFLSFYHPAKRSIARLREAKSLVELCKIAAAEVQDVTGFDRVIVYKFDTDWNGEVIAESLKGDIDSYLGLHFPASDVPKQARDLYALNMIRNIPDIHYEPSEIVPAVNPVSNAPLDLAYSVLRSVSPVHREYLKNMGCSASMSVSLMKEGRLWGLISCTHVNGPKYLPYEIRSVCEFLGEIVSSLLSAHELNERYDERMAVKSAHAALVENMAKHGDFIRGLSEENPSLMDLVDAEGAAIYFSGKWTVFGKAPSDRELNELLQWLTAKEFDDLFVTESLPLEFQAAYQFKEFACGLIAAPLSRSKSNFVLWFRPEVVQIVSWGGDPTKPVEFEDDHKRLHPRRSFEQWKEKVSLRSLPWKPHELEAASAFKRAIMDVAMQQSEGLMKLNTELKRSNLELDSFAYAASHDLKEPLRGIHNYANFILRDRNNVLTEVGVSRLETVIRLSQRMEHLINSLLHYSQVGRMDLSMRSNDLNDVVGQVLDTLRPLIEESRAIVHMDSPLPVMTCDRVKVAEVFSNLIANAIRYNDNPEKTVHIGADRAGDKVLFYVRDNGIGIAPEFQETIFKIFRRLHQRDKYGGGTGTGLTIAKRIIERHGGDIWVESNGKNGTTFFFTLGGMENAECRSLTPRL